MNILGIIPARGGSKGVKRKNIRVLGAYPLIKYTIDSSKESKFLTQCIVSTEDREIRETSIQCGAHVPFLRPEVLAKDTTPTIDVIKNALDFYSDLVEDYDAVCLLQPTSPFRPSGFIDKCIESFISEQADTLISVQKVPDHYNPHWVFEIDNENKASLATKESAIITRRQELPDCYSRDGMIYIIKTRTILDRSSIWGEKIVCEINDAPRINIDSLNDWNRAEEFLKKNPNYFLK